MLYNNQIDTKEELKQKVQTAFNELESDTMCKATNGHIEKRLIKCLEVNGNISNI